MKYLIPPYKVRVSQDSNNNKQYYSTEPAFDYTKYFTLTKSIEKKILKEDGFLDSEILKFDNLLGYLKNSIDEKLSIQFQNKKPRFLHFIRDWMLYRIIGLENLMPLLIDDKVQEIYMDKPNTPLYLDHQDFGRCLTDIILTIEELEHFKTRLCLEKDTSLNLLNPSLKVELETDKFHIRSAIDIPPLASDGMSMNIRKLRRKIWTLPELITQKMLTIEAATYILFVLKRRFNFTIIGEPGSGKTTLANAIDLLTPYQWRKITIEDVIESIEQTQFNKFQTRYSVSTFDSNISQNSKSQEIIKLLHRSPTWVFLGEIQTAEHSEALFEALSAGLVGIQTCHGRSIEMMIIRWLNQHKIPLSSILTLDILIENTYSFSNWNIKRNLNRILEISKSDLYNGKLINSLNNLDLVEVFAYDTIKKRLISRIDLFETPVLKEIRKRENLSRNQFEEEFALLSRKLMKLVEKKMFDPNKIISILSDDRRITINAMKGD